MKKNIAWKDKLKAVCFPTWVAYLISQGIREVFSQQIKCWSSPQRCKFTTNWEAYSTKMFHIYFFLSLLFFFLIIEMIFFICMEKKNKEEKGERKKNHFVISQFWKQDKTWMGFYSEPFWDRSTGGLRK